MKKLLKSEICGTCEQCTDTLFIVEKSKHTAGKKKEKKGKKRKHGCALDT